MPTSKTKPLKIHVDTMSSVWVDADEFLAQPKVQRRMEVLKKMNLAGKKLVGNKLIPIDADTEKTSKDS